MALALSTERAPLLHALGTVLKAVEARQTIPVLGHLLIEAESDTLKVTGTDLDIQVTATLPATIEGEGSATVPAQAFRDLVRKAPEKGEMRLVHDEGRRATAIQAGRAKAIVPGFDVADFPNLAFVAEEGFHDRFTIGGAQFASLLERCEFAISTEETRYYLNGIFFHVVDASDGPALRLVGTDGLRLARMGAAAPQGLASNQPGVIIPRKTVALARDLAAGAGKEALSIGLSARAIKLEAGPLLITSKLIDGTFPDYQRVIPLANDRLARVPAKPLSRILDFCATLNLAKRPAVKLQFTSGHLVASLRNGEGAEVSDEIEVDYDGSDFEIGIDAKYLSEILDKVGADTACLRLPDNPSGPMLIGDRLEEALFVLMPLRV